MAEPAPTPDTDPVELPIVATPVLLLLQPPPEVPSVRVTVPVLQTEVAPVIATGKGFIVMVFVV